ncbi:NAD-dependent dihydropyrimidine dehydrogenase PreA subunit [Methanofollis sp. W23]|uniref:hypothetical protein n=1 Tax=Methanofollis sp. W23 TaxID=2817849 RepID=UPI001AEAFD2F|nr:hypothetical protein [Methanofollis sp. W23]MBP2145427.1 NAD-dependent dihydropyrimidine dehydrogenase PreA subunit [Methanofollis sp. W23]
MDLAAEAVIRAQDLGATVAGCVLARALNDCPSALSDGPPGFCADTGSFMVLGLFHDPDRPELDWWEEGQGTPGDQMLHQIAEDLCRWLGEVHGTDARVLPYQIYDGGIYLKDAAVMAGLGFVGRNNLVIVPGCGPSIRFRALWVDVDVPELPVMPCSSFCEECSAPCLRACPMHAFSGGRYHRAPCLERIDVNKTTAKGERRAIDHCRVCELVCPAGRES